MKSRFLILQVVLCLVAVSRIYSQQTIDIDYFGNKLSLPYSKSMDVTFTDGLSYEKIVQYYEKMKGSYYQPTIDALLEYKNENKLDDWLYYQLIRRTAQYISPKQENYNQYTLYKWFLLMSSGYEATLKISGDQILFYILCEEKIYNIPNYIKNGKQYVCLNYHDYAVVDFEKNRFEEVALDVDSPSPFSYKVTTLPELASNNSSEKLIQFTYYDRSYDFNLKYNSNIKSIFNNYPVVDYESYFNIPMSRVTYQSLIPALKENVASLSIADGIDYLMRFTRYAFLFQPDTKIYGSEKRLSPEQTLISESSDCEDRTALFFYLVKELYDLPMIVLAFQNHVSIAVKFDKPKGQAILYNGVSYSICEPSPQKKDLRIGELPKELKGASFEIAYVYNPDNKK